MSIQKLILSISFICLSMAISAQSINLNVQTVHTDVELSWSAAAYEQAEVFEIEYAENGIAFNMIAALDATEDANSFYSFYDEDKAGIAGFYRIKALNSNGDFVYSQVFETEANEMTEEEEIAALDFEPIEYKTSYQNILQENEME